MVSTDQTDVCARSILRTSLKKKCVCAFVYICMSVCETQMSKNIMTTNRQSKQHRFTFINCHEGLGHSSEQ